MDSTVPLTNRLSYSRARRVVFQFSISKLFNIVSRQKFRENQEFRCEPILHFVHEPLSVFCIVVKKKKINAFASFEGNFINSPTFSTAIIVENTRRSAVRTLFVVFDRNQIESTRNKKNAVCFCQANTGKQRSHDPGTTATRGRGALIIYIVRANGVYEIRVYMSAFRRVLSKSNVRKRNDRLVRFFGQPPVFPRPRRIDPRVRKNVFVKNTLVLRVKRKSLHHVPTVSSS